MSVKDSTDASKRDSAYTTSRSDVFDLVPQSAQAILDVGCSNGALGRRLRAALPGRVVVGIELNTQFAEEAAAHLGQLIQVDLSAPNWHK